MGMTFIFQGIVCCSESSVLHLTDIVKGFASLQDANTMYVAPAGYRMFWTVTPFILSADIGKLQRLLVIFLQTHSCL